VPAHYVGHEPGVLNIFFEYSLKIPWIYSNMLEHTRIYSNTSLSGRRGGLSGEAGRRVVWAGGRIDNPRGSFERYCTQIPMDL
jgi:hypothetical protein